MERETLTGVADGVSLADLDSIGGVGLRMVGLTFWIGGLLDWLAGLMAIVNDLSQVSYSAG